MNIQPIFSPSSKSAPLPAMPHKSCAFCGSVFITETECESCGRQFNKEVLGTPGGEKSFYTLKERYKKDVGPFFARFDKFLAPDAAIRVRYLAILKKRFLTLIDYLGRPGRGAIGAHAYLIEFRDLVVEMRRMKIDAEYIYDMVELNEGATLTPKLLGILNEEFSGMGNSSFAQFLRYRIAGGPRLGFILGMVLSYGGICVAALVAFSYFAKR